MINGKVHIDAVVFEDLVALLKSKSKVLDKKTISLGVLNLEIDEQTKRTLEEEIRKINDPQESLAEGGQMQNNNINTNNQTPSYQVPSSTNLNLTSSPAAMFSQNGVVLLSAIFWLSCGAIRL